jgi:hypothetical protein
MIASDTSAGIPAIEPAVARAMLKWPNVPVCYGWLGLDRRGRWRLQDAPLLHPNLIAFINRNYSCDTAGRWYFQNGPQRVFVDLDYTPWVLRLAPDDTVTTHTGRTVTQIHHAYLDELGQLLFAFDAGVGLADPADAQAWLSRVVGSGGGAPADPVLEQQLSDLLGGRSVELMLHTGLGRIGLSPMRSTEVPRRFGFVQNPRPDSQGAFRDEPDAR